jgi:aminoglycoside phosphotransferase (APT) family kinase protein
MDRKIKRVLSGQLHTAKLKDCLRQRSLIRRYMIPELNDSPWVMVHGDLSVANITTDSDDKISG